MKVFFPKRCVWDIDYFKNDILPSHTDFIMYDLNNISIIYSDEPNILVVTSHMKWHSFNFSKLKPEIVYFISDEEGVHHIMVNELKKCTKRLIVNYNHGYTNGLLQIPIGYVNTMFSGKKSTDVIKKKINERKYDWSFVGMIKSDRPEMLSKFSNAFPNNYCKTGRNRWEIDQLITPPSEMAELYNDSIFVLNGRGNLSINCYRVYEAIICGAIPVIVGKESELSLTFYFNGMRPECIYCEDWDSAVIKCRDLLKNKLKLQKMQDSLVKWWNLQIFKKQNNISV